MNNDIDYDTRQWFISEKLNSIGQTERTDFYFVTDSSKSWILFWKLGCTHVELFAYHRSVAYLRISIQNQNLRSGIKYHTCRDHKRFSLNIRSFVKAWCRQGLGILLCNFVWSSINLFHMFGIRDQKVGSAIKKTSLVRKLMFSDYILPISQSKVNKLIVVIISNTLSSVWKQNCYRFVEMTN